MGSMDPHPAPEFTDWLARRTEEAVAFDASLPPEAATVRARERSAVCRMLSMHTRVGCFRPGLWLRQRVASVLRVSVDDVTAALKAAEDRASR
jgi:hypothetical protein